jgi:hypothetical protein
MNTEGLQRIIRAAAAMLAEDTVVIIGSQSILASYREFMLPDDATMSAEADIVPFDDDDEHKADKVDGLLGEASHFYAKYGIYADGVSPWTAGFRAAGTSVSFGSRTPRAARWDCACTPRIYAWRRSSPAGPRTSGSSMWCSTPGLSILRWWLANSPPLRCAAVRPKCCDMPNACSQACRAVPTTYASGPAVAAADIARLHDELARMRDASVLCGRTNRDGTICRNDRRACPEHP